MLSPSIQLLLSRKSHNKLIAPAPTSEQLGILIKAALRAPDHASLKPWRYRIFEGESLLELGEKFAQATVLSDSDLSEAKRMKVSQKPLRAPMVIVASVVIKAHPKVPKSEQVLSGGASVQNLIMAAHFLGVGAMWRTGGLASNRHLMKLLNFEDNEEIIGFIYLGQEDGVKRKVNYLNNSDFVIRS